VWVDAKSMSWSKLALFARLNSPIDPDKSTNSVTPFGRLNCECDTNDGIFVYSAKEFNRHLGGAQGPSWCSLECLHVD